MSGRRAQQGCGFGDVCEVGLGSCVHHLLVRQLLRLTVPTGEQLTMTGCTHSQRDQVIQPIQANLPTVLTR